MFTTRVESKVVLLRSDELAKLVVTPPRNGHVNEREARELAISLLILGVELEEARALVHLLQTVGRQTTRRKSFSIGNKLV